MEERGTAERLAKTVRVGGYIIEAGSIIGFSIGIYLLFSRSLFSSLFHIGSTEVTAYFIGVFIPSFIILAIIGYLLVLPFGPKTFELSTIMSFCFMSFLVIVLSAFSILFFVSLIGGMLVLTASIRMYTKPTFKTLSKRETFFMVEIGAMLIAAFSTLLLLMQVAPSFFQSYSTGSYGSFPVFTLLMAVVFSFLTFFGVPLFGSRGTNAGTSGTLGLVMTVLSFVFVIQNQYDVFSVSGFVGMAMLVLGFLLSAAGNLGYLWLFLSEIVATDVFSVSPLDRGGHCPYCGRARLIAEQTTCSSCGRSLTWTPYAPYCSSCGLLVPEGAKACPHCKEDLLSKRIYYYGQFERREAILDRAVEKLEHQRTWTARIQLRILHGLKGITALAGRFGRAVVRINDRLSLTLKDVFVIGILCAVFNFLAFIISNRWDFVDIGWGWLTYGNFYGYPFEWLLIKKGGFPLVDVFWGALLLDILLYSLLATVIVIVAEKLRRHF
jgi:hypothetical protein